MRKSAITAAVLAFSTLVGTAQANDDFSALLADLSFGDAAPSTEPTSESLTVVQEETLQDLMPPPSGLTMPGMLESNPEPSPAAPQANELFVVEEVAKAPAPQVALMDPIPAGGPEDNVDLEAAFTLQEAIVPSATTVGHVLHHGNHCETGCEMGQVCRPRGAVRLPYSTFYQYFRSHPCYTNVWDGYGIYCGSHHKHLHGECDCFNQSHHGNCDGCDKCDACGSR